MKKSNKFTITKSKRFSVSTTFKIQSNYSDEFSAIQTFIFDNLLLRFSEYHISFAKRSTTELKALSSVFGNKRTKVTFQVEKGVLVLKLNNIDQTIAHKVSIWLDSYKEGLEYIMTSRVFLRELTLKSKLETSEGEINSDVKKANSKKPEVLKKPKSVKVKLSPELEIALKKKFATYWRKKKKLLALTGPIELVGPKVPVVSILQKVDTLNPEEKPEEKLEEKSGEETNLL